MKKVINRFLFIPLFLMGFLCLGQTEDYKVWEENFNLGFNLYNNNQFAQAEIYFKKALDASEAAFEDNAEEPITTLYLFANCKFVLSQFNEALALFNDVLAKAQNLSERNVDFELKVRSEICSIFSTIGNFEKAIFEQEKLNTFIKDNLGEQTEYYAANLNNLGQLYFYLGNCEEALKHYNKAKSIFLDLRLRTIDVATVYNNLGLCYFGAGDYENANATYLEAFNIVEELEQFGTHFYSKLISNIAVLSQVEGDYESSKTLHEQSLSILFDLNLSNTIEYAEGLFVYGSLLKDLGRYDNALYEVNNAKKLYDKFLEPDHLKYADINALLAELHLINGETKEALKYYEQATQLFKEKTPETNPGYGYALNGLGNTYQVLGDYEKALQYYLEAQKYLRISLSESHKDFGITIMNIATVKASLGEYLEAFDFYSNAIDVISNAIGTQNTIYGQLCLGILDVIYIIPNEKIKDYQNLIDTSLSIFKAIEDGNNLHYYNALFFNGIKNLENKQYDLSLEIFLEIEVKINKDIEKNSNIYNKVINHIASNYMLLEDYENAFKYFKIRNDNIIKSVTEVFSFRSEKDKRTYLKSIESWFSDVTKISIEENFNNSDITSMSLNNQLLRKGLLLNSSKDIISQLLTLNNPEINAKIQEFKSLKDLIIYMELLPEIQNLEELEKVKTDLNRFETELVELYSSNFSTNSNFNKDWKNIKASLKQNEVAIEFVSYKSSVDSKYIAYVIKKDSQFPEVVKLFNEQELKNILSKKTPNQLYASRGSKAKGISSTKDLYDVIWKPLEQYLEGTETIYYSPVGLLNQIPFSAINAEGEDILSTKYNLVQLSSADLLANKLNEPTSENTLFIGGIDYEYSLKETVKKTDNTELRFLESSKGTRSLGTTWNYLPGTLSEIEDLQKLFSISKKAYSSLIKKTATEEAIKALSGNSPNVLHIATHGFFFENLQQQEGPQQEWSPELVYKASEDPLMRSGLILAGANYAWNVGVNPDREENGILTALEISNLDLSKTNMVVLSACETGLGDIDGSEGVYGLQRAFKMAGVDIIVMSLWEVPDKETAEFMNSFYTNWLSGMKVREAFNETQRAMSTKYKDTPEKWAAFVLFE